MKPIPFRERLVVRLALGMIAVALLSLVITFTLQFVSVMLSDIHPPNLESRLDKIIQQNPDDKELLALIEAPLRIRTIVARAGLISLFISGALWIFFAIYFARSIARPIEDVTLASAQITHGDLATRVQMPKRARGEPARLLEHFNEMASSLETYERERTEMIASIAHELRTPLAVMRSRLEILEEGLVTLSQDEVGRLMRQVDLLTRLVNDLRTLSLADAKRLSLNLADVNLEELVNGITESLQSRAREQGTRLELATKPVVIQGDVDRLTQVIFNLLDNALKYTPKEGRILVSLLEHNNKVELSVQNSGPTFTVAPEQLFKRFYSSNQAGSGIGLAVVKSIVELHKGTVTAHNLKDEGVVFSVNFPKAQRELV